MMIFAIHAPASDKLKEVIAEMKQMGAPTIEVVDCGDHYMALEGSHRIAAAAALELTPELVIYDQDDEINIQKYDWFDSANWAETRYPAGEVAGELYAPNQACDYQFD